MKAKTYKCLSQWLGYMFKSAKESGGRREVREHEILQEESVFGVEMISQPSHIEEKL